MENDQLLLRFRDDAQLAPFIVFTAGRSRTMWLSAFLTYGICACNFEAAAKVSSFQEVVHALNIPGIGSAETAAAPAWRLLKIAAPTLRSVVVRRPRKEILASFEAMTKDRVELDMTLVEKMLARAEHYLELISSHPDTLTVSFKDLEKEETCKAIFEHCLPYKHDSGWWNFMRQKVLDTDIVQLAELYRRRQEGFMALSREVRHLTFKLARQGHIRKAA